MPQSRHSMLSCLLHICSCYIIRPTRVICYKNKLATLVPVPTRPFDHRTAQPCALRPYQPIKSTARALATDENIFESNQSISPPTCQFGKSGHHFSFHSAKPQSLTGFSTSLACSIISSRKPISIVLAPRPCNRALHASTLESKTRCVSENVGLRF